MIADPFELVEQMDESGNREESIVAAGQLTFEEYLEFQKSLVRGRRLLIRLALGGYGVFMVGRALASGSLQAGVVYWSLAAVLCLYPLIVSPWLFRFRTRQLWVRSPLSRKEFRFEVSREGVTTPDDRGQPAFTDWSSFDRWEESRSLFLIFLSARLALLVPKRVMEEPRHELLREMLVEALGPRGGGGRK